MKGQGKAARSEVRKALCKNIEILGFCKFADSCKFAHSTEELAINDGSDSNSQWQGNSDSQWQGNSDSRWQGNSDSPWQGNPDPEWVAANPWVHKWQPQAPPAKAAPDWGSTIVKPDSYGKQSDWSGSRQSSDWSDWQDSMGRSKKQLKNTKLRSTGQICLGRVKLLKENHGFIRCDEVKDQFGGADVFCGDFSQLSGRTVGELVTFDLVLNKDGKPQACNVRDAPAEYTNVYDFASKNNLDGECIEIMNRQAQHVQEGVMKMGPVTNTTGGDPISIITSRIKKVAAKQMFDCRKVQSYENPEDIANAVKVFCAENGLDQDCSDRLARCAPEVQKLVVVGGHVAGSKNPSAMVMGRIAKAQQQCRPPPQITMPPPNMMPMQPGQVGIPPPPAPDFASNFPPGFSSGPTPNPASSSNPPGVSFSDIASSAITNNTFSSGGNVSDLDFLSQVQFDEPAYKRSRTD